MQTTSPRKTVLLIGASRGLGLAMAEEYAKRGWRVIATTRSTSTDKLGRIAKASDGAVEIETVDINVPEQVAALRARLKDRRLDVLFVNAGVKNDDRETIADVSTEEFVRVMVTNSLSPMRVIETLQDLVPPTGTIAVMSSGQGVRTDMGGPAARLSVDESIPNLLNTMEVYEGRGGLHYLDYLGKVVPW